MTWCFNPSTTNRWSGSGAATFIHHPGAGVSIHLPPTGGLEEFIPHQLINHEYLVSIHLPPTGGLEVSLKLDGTNVGVVFQSIYHQPVVWKSSVPTTLASAGQTQAFSFEKMYFPAGQRTCKDGVKRVVAHWQVAEHQAFGWCFVEEENTKTTGSLYADFAVRAIYATGPNFCSARKRIFLNDPTDIFGDGFDDR